MDARGGGATPPRELRRGVYGPVTFSAKFATHQYGKTALPTVRAGVDFSGKARLGCIRSLHHRAGKTCVRSRTNRSFNKSSLDDETLLSGQFWGELRVFLAVAKTKSFNRAAEITNTSQPTVSRQVKRLQDVVGSQSFISTPRGVKLTEKGEALAKALSRLDHTLFSITSDLRAESSEAEGIVRVSITDGLNAVFAAPSLVRFSDQYPEFNYI